MALVIVLAGAITAFVPAGVAAQQPVIVGQTSVGWTGDWQYDAASSMEQQATMTQVDAATGTIKLATYGEFMDNSVYSASDALETFATSFFDGAGATAIVEQNSGQFAGGGVWKSYTFDLQGLDLAFLATVSQSANGAYIVSTLTGNTDQFQATIAEAQREITLNGQPTFLEGIRGDAVLPSQTAAADPQSGSGGVNTGSSSSVSLPGSQSGSVPSSKELEILSISSKDAGIGDGTLYVYVEVVNNTSKLYSYVGVEGTCRDAAGGIQGTGIGNTMNVASGETVVITMIIMGVPGCADIDVRFDGLTGMM